MHWTEYKTPEESQALGFARLTLLWTVHDLGEVDPRARSTNKETLQRYPVEVGF